MAEDFREEFLSIEHEKAQKKKQCITLLLDKIQKLEQRIDYLEDRLLQSDRYQEIIPTSIGVYDYKGQTVAFSLPETVPSDAKEVILLTFLRSGNEGPSRSFITSIYTEDQQSKYTRYVKGARYPQSAISFSSENISLPLVGGKKVFVESQDVQIDNCHGLELIVLGFRR